MTLRKVTLLITLAICQTFILAEVYDRCTLIQDIKKTDLIDYKGYTLGDYVCLAYYVSYYNTSLHASKSEYGIYQVNSYWWCDDGNTVGRKNLCGVLCTDLLDNNIENDLHCLKRIAMDPDGLAAWPVWESQCKGKDLTRFTDGC